MSQLPTGREPAPSMTDRVAARLAAHFAEIGLSDGDSIPSTGKLADEFGVSRTVIREALAQLSGQGLLDRRQGREGVIRRPQAEQLSTLLSSKFTIERASLRDLHAFREVVEVGAARLAAARPDGPIIARLSDLLSEMRSGKDDIDLLKADVEFHRTIANAANPVFGFVLEGLAGLLMESRQAVWDGYLRDGGTNDVAVDRHIAIRDAIAAGDPEAAARAMVEDLADTERGLGDPDR
ncbi:FadR/GntR family transcriptional regulator [Microbacterium sp. W4I20]|uniref:FadR/GntR family transcriptional regulator n=1 Tax=Microbacterium sp. W4I20 TaxID=3042262 RepID=UPI00278B5CA9|nr:FCD domain-containing protein [Microbacterium sp. W4I20]MDQ0726731.1 GntR family transcriptional repressor for pyruvate dehydrogenase complex [Microbacterium sp. W4I20]